MNYKDVLNIRFILNIIFLIRQEFHKIACLRMKYDVLQQKFFKNLVAGAMLGFKKSSGFLKENLQIN